jgi:hypothetical protein
MEKPTDTLVLECPQCKNQFPVCVYSGSGTGEIYGVENAPLKILAEVNANSKKGEIQCIHCFLTIAVQVLYLPYVRGYSAVQFEGWQDLSKIKDVKIT